ncbi:MAG: ABC transporter substrate-binding protein [Chloroflexi bacterium]|nr:ABC transporter substrate-binding protein [Chloroflexota bacterium]
MKKGSLLCLALSLVALPACAAPTPTATPTKAPAAVALTPTKAAPTPTKRPVNRVEVMRASVGALTTPPAMVALEKGFFLEEGLDVSWVTTGSGSKALAAVAGRSALIANVVAPDMISAAAQGQPAQAFAQLGTGVPGRIIIRKEVAEQRGITPKMTLEEKGRATKGLTFAASSPGSGSDYRIRYFLRKSGLDPDRDVTVTYVGIPGMLPALEIGAVDAFYHSNPELVIVPVQQGTAVTLVDFVSGEVPGTADVYDELAVAHRDDLDRQTELFEAYVRGLWRGMKFIAEREVEARDLLKERYASDMDPALYRQAWEAQLPGFVKEPSLTTGRLQATLDFRNATADPPPLELKFEDFGTNRFVEAAKKTLGY